MSSGMNEQFSATRKVAVVCAKIDQDSAGQVQDQGYFHPRDREQICFPTTMLPPCSSFLPLCVITGRLSLWGAKL
jgi:hypothetical protein